MKHPFENQGSRPAWEDLTTQELDDLLAQDFAAGQDGLLEPEAILAMTEVINRREEDTPTDAGVQAAWERFRARIREEETTPTESIPEELPAAPEAVSFAKPERKKPRWRKLRWAVAVAAVVCLLVTIMMVPVSGERGVDRMVRWTEQHFSFGTQNSLPQERPGGVTYKEVQETVEGLTIQHVLPNWYPEGTVLEELAVNEMFDGTNVNVSFSLKDKEFSLNIDVYDLEPIGTTKYEKNEGPVEAYYVNRVPHYIMGNMDKHIVVWKNGNTENFIQGDLTVEELKLMIDSIYE